jgi:hypothetical protein
VLMQPGRAVLAIVVEVEAIAELACESTHTRAQSETASGG